MVLGRAAANVCKFCSLLVISGWFRGQVVGSEFTVSAKAMSIQPRQET